MAAHVLRRLRHATWPPGQRHAVKPAIISNFPFHAYHSLKPGGEIAVTSIYRHHVLHGTGTFETDPPAESDMATRRADVLAKGLPYLVAVDERSEERRVGKECRSRWSPYH